MLTRQGKIIRGKLTTTEIAKPGKEGEGREAGGGMEGGGGRDREGQGEEGEGEWGCVIHPCAIGKLQAHLNE